MVTGCAAEESPPSGGQQVVLALAEDADQAGAEAQYDMLRDGDVTRSEYAQALDQMAACWLELGVQMSEPYVNPVDGIQFMYDVSAVGPTAPDVEGSQEECRTANLSFVEQAFVGSTEPVMDPRLQSAVVQCVGERGLRVTGDEVNLRELVDAVGEAEAGEVTGCLDSVIREVFPDIGPYGVSY